jgi:hypothetical protein
MAEEEGHAVVSTQLKGPERELSLSRLCFFQPTSILAKLKQEVFELV